MPPHTGRTIVATVGGVEHRFRPLPADDARALSEAVRAAPELTFELCLDACGACYLGTPEAFDAASDAYPLAFAELVARELLVESGKASKALVRASLGRWKRSEKDLVGTARNLLAFKAYTSGDPSEEALAGALHVADYMDHSKALFRVVLGFFKAMAKAKR